MRHFPVFLTLRDRKVLVLGDGEAAARKAELVAAAGANLRRRPAFDPADLDGCALAIGADAAEPDLIALSAAAQARGIPVNIVDRPALCSCLMPAIVDRDPVTIAVSTGGAAPVLARLLRARIEAAIAPAYGRLAALAEEITEPLRARLPDLARRRRVLERILGGRVSELLLAGNEPAARAALAEELAGEEPPPRGVVVLAGIGPGPADLVTLRTQRALGEADIVAHPPDIPRDILALARRDAARAALADGATTIDRLRALAAPGNRVVRLIPGDGAAVARREGAALRAAGCLVEECPGLPTPGLSPGPAIP